MKSIECHECDHNPKNWSVDKLDYEVIKLTKIRDDKKYKWFDARKAIFTKAGFYVLRYNLDFLPDRQVYADKPDPDNQNRSFWITVPNPRSEIHDGGQCEWTSRGGGFHSEVTHWRYMTPDEEGLFRLSLKSKSIKKA